MLFGIEPEKWLAFTVIATIISTLGSLFGNFLQNYLFTRSFEKWKQHQLLEQVYQRFRDPLLLSSREFASRTVEILKDYPTTFLVEENLAIRPARMLENSVDDPYYKRYKLMSTAYRYCSFFGWLELYRQEITFLHAGNSEHAQALELAVGRVRNDLADGNLNTAKDIQTWTDALIFREELRAIGESMIETRGSSRTIVGYGRFSELIECEAPNTVQRWLPVVVGFIVGLQNKKDFRRIRFERLVVHVVELMKLLDDRPIEKKILEAYEKAKKAIGTE